MLRKSGMIVVFVLCGRSILMKLRVHWSMFRHGYLDRLVHIFVRFVLARCIWVT